MKHVDLPFIKWISYKRKIRQDNKSQRADCRDNTVQFFFSSNWVQSSGGFRSIYLACSRLQSFQNVFYIGHFYRTEIEIGVNTEKFIMSHESLARMVEYSHKMIDTIAKEVEDNFITRK